MRSRDSLRRPPFKPALELLERRDAPAVVNMNIAPTATGPGLLNGGNYNPLAAATAQPNNDNQTSKINFLSQDVNFGRTAEIDVTYPAIDSAGITEYWCEANVLNRTGQNWSGFDLELGFGTGSGFTAAPSLAGHGLSFDVLDQVCTF